MAKALNVSRDEAVKLFKELGWKADEWEDKKIKKRLANLAELAGDKEAKSAPMKELHKSILDAGSVVLVNGSAAKADKGESAPGGRGGKKATKNEEKKGGKKKAERAESSGEKDKFGNRLGTRLAKFNAALSAKPKSMKEILEEIGEERSFYNHANALVAEGMILKTEDGKYKLKK